MEVEVVAHYYVIEDVIARDTGIDVLDHRRACLGPVTPPQLPAVGSVIGIEVEGVAHDCKGGRSAILVSSQINERHEHHRACLGPVAPPQFLATAVIRCEVDVAAHDCEMVWVTAAIPSRARVDVLDHHRACLGPVAPPQLRAVGSVVGWEKEVVAKDHPDKLLRTAVLSDFDVLDQP